MGGKHYSKKLDFYSFNDLKCSIWQRDSFRCKYCHTDMKWAWVQWRLWVTFKGKFGKKMKMRDRPTVDHVKPLSKGGETTFKNLVTSCYYCNQKKGNR